MALLLSLVAASLAAAPAHPVAGHQDVVPVNGAFGHDLLWRSYLRFYEPELLPPDDLPPPLCSTALVSALQAEWDAFTPAEQARIAARVAPGLGTLRPTFPARAAAPVAQAAGASPPPPNEVCWGDQAFGKAQILRGEHFQVEYLPNTISSGEAEDLLAELDATYALQVEDLGWRAPEGASRWLIPFYVVESGAASAYTTINPCDGDDLPYIVANSGSFFDDEWWQDMAAHEFNHAIQFGYGSAVEFWWWEATATYMQEYAYPAHNEWVPYITGYTEQPFQALSASDQADYNVFWHMYGMAIWNFWIDENHGGLPTILAMWEASEGKGNAYYDLTQQEMMADVGLEFGEVYSGFVAANTVMDYAEGDAMPEIDLEDVVTDLPADDASDASAPHAYGQNYWRFDLKPPTGKKTDLELTFTGDEPANWLVQLIGAGADELKTVIEVPIEGSTGTAVLEDYADYGQVFLVVSPRKDASGTFSYSWSAKGVEPLVPEDTGTPPEEEEAEEPVPTDAVALESGGCGCAVSTPGATAWPGALAALALLSRRRARRA